ncbi:MAG: SBBP repeat-containing protein [Bacteroidota bacterium]
MRKLLLLYSLCICLTNKSQQAMQWAKANSGNGLGLQVSTDASGNIYHCGNFSGTVDFDPGPGVFTLTALGTTDSYLSKFDPNGNLIWVKAFGGTGVNSISSNSFKQNNAGEFFITGYFGGTIDFDPGPSFFNLSSGPATALYVLKLDPSGNFIWAKSVSSVSNSVYGLSIAIDNSNNSYITGYYYGSIDFNPGPGTFSLNANGQKDIYILKLDNLGNFVWAKGMGGSFDDSGSRIHIDDFGNVWTTGYFVDLVDFDPGIGLFNLSSLPSYGVFISKLDANGNFILAKAFTGAGTSEATTITTDGTGNAYLTGFFNATTDFDPNFSSFNLTPVGVNDVFVVKLNPTGNLLWAKSFGGSAIEIGRNIALDSENNIYVTGNFQGTCDFDPNGGVYNLTSAGADDVYICKLDNSGNFLCAGAMGSAAGDVGLSICLDLDDNILITGYFQGVADFDPSSAVFNLNPIGSFEAFIAKYAAFVTLPINSYSICEGAAITLTTSGADSYTWTPPAGLNTTNSATVVANPTISTTYSVIGKTGCYITSTPMAVNLLAKPLFTSPSNPQKLYCVPDSTLLQSIASNSTTSFKWRKSVSSSYTVQPYYAKTPGNYYGIATNILNGCSDSSLINVINYQNYPNSKINSHPYLGPLIPVDTVTCIQPTVTLNGGSDSVGVNSVWRNTATNAVNSNPIQLNAQANLKLIVTNTLTGCADSSLFVLVAQSNAIVNYSLNSTNHQINCSMYTATIQAIGTNSTHITTWSGPSFTNQPNPQIVNAAGIYTVTSTNTLNGCFGIKTVTVAYTNSLILQSSNDTLVCKNSALSLLSSAIGTVSGITYSWSNGAINSINPITAGTTNTYIVNASGGGCIGSDTVIVNVAPLTNDSIVAYKNCSTPTLGSIVIFVKSGISPFQYSINNGVNYSASNTFSNLPLGTYTTSIKDGLGCVKLNTITIDALSNLPTPKFIASTLNTKNDTIVLVDISVPKPDSVQWILPNNVIKIGGTMFSPVIAVNDTGSFNVTMKAFYGSCIINTTKLVKFGKVDTLIANNYNANGIKSILLYPNPNNGQFSVDIEFYKKQNASVQVLSSNGAQLFQQTFYDESTFNLPFNLTQLINGTYVLRVIGEYDVKSISFIISK